MLEETLTLLASLLESERPTRQVGTTVASIHRASFSRSRPRNSETYRERDTLLDETTQQLGLPSAG
jgi:hypothetical protein